MLVCLPKCISDVGLAVLECRFLTVSIKLCYGIRSNLVNVYNTRAMTQGYKIPVCCRDSADSNILFCKFPVNPIKQCSQMSGRTLIGLPEAVHPKGQNSSI